MAEDEPVDQATNLLRGVNDASLWGFLHTGSEVMVRENDCRYSSNECLPLRFGRLSISG